jgi:hypothetical protein
MEKHIYFIIHKFCLQNVLISWALHTDPLHIVCKHIYKTFHKIVSPFLGTSAAKAVCAFLFAVNLIRSSSIIL